jgi:hypothetical protein
VEKETHCAGSVDCRPSQALRTLAAPICPCHPCPPRDEGTSERYDAPAGSRATLSRPRRRNTAIAGGERNSRCFGKGESTAQRELVHRWSRLVGQCPTPPPACICHAPGHTRPVCLRLARRRRYVGSRWCRQPGARVGVILGDSLISPVVGLGLLGGRRRSVPAPPSPKSRRLGDDDAELKYSSCWCRPIA